MMKMDLIQKGNEMIKLWRKNSLGIGTWRIWIENDFLVYAHASVEGGSEIMHRDRVVTNQSGRTLEQQLELELNSRLSRQLDKGYKRSKEEALQSGSTNQLGLANPMLAQPLDKVRVTSLHRTFVQPKYDGHRCLITKQGGEILAYTRKGKGIETIPHILTDIDRWLPDGYTLDGELYIPNTPFQTISSVIKRIQPMNAKLHFHLYDMIQSAPFDERWSEIMQMYLHVNDTRIVLTPTMAVNDWDEVYALFRKFRQNGLEGAMLRRSIRGYEDAKRSDQLVKIKERADMEVTCISIRPSKDGWAILTCKMPNGKIFDLSAPGSIPEKMQPIQQPDKYIGRDVTIEYANLTVDGLPFHAVALRWRDDL